MHFKPFRSLALAAIPLLPATLLADTPASTQWIVTSAKVSGGGNDYVTSLRIVNPNAAAVEVDMYFLPQTPLDASNNALGDNSAAPKVAVTVPANSTLALDDVLASKFGTAGAGGIRIESFAATGGLNPAPAGVWVLSQTLVVNAKNQAGTPGTNGFAIPSQNQDQVVAVGETAYVPYISGSPSTTPPSGYRTNLFLLSTNATGTTGVTVTLRKGDGTSLGSKNITLGKLSQTQINNIASFFGYVPAASDTNLTALVTVTSGGPVATGASIIDNAIGSISYAPPVKMPVANNGAYGLILDDGGTAFRGAPTSSTARSTSSRAGIVIPSCGGQDTLFFIQGFGTDSRPEHDVHEERGRQHVLRGNPGRRLRHNGATFSGTIQTNFDGTDLRHPDVHARRRARRQPVPRRDRDVHLHRRQGPGPVRRCPARRADALTLCAAVSGARFPRPRRTSTASRSAACRRSRSRPSSRIPARYSAKAVRVEGANAGAAGRPALKDGDAVLPVVSDGSFKLPQDLAGGFLAAEGRARAAETGAVFVATGVEVRREGPAR